MNKQRLIYEVKKLKNVSWVSNKIISQFIDFIKNQPSLTKEERAGIHICSFFLPVHIKTKFIYLVHHIKANDWIPPGGHINKNELPIETVKREFEEELSHKLTNEKIELFDLSIKEINRPHQNCLIHYDIWYLVYTKKLPFKFLRREFYDAGWFNLNEGVKKIKLKKYRDIVKKLHLIL